MKYLIETRLSGALTVPKSAIVLTIDSTYSGGIPADTGTSSTTMEYGITSTGGDTISREPEPEKPIE